MGTATERVVGFFDALEGKLSKRKGELAGVSGTFQFRVGEEIRWLALADGAAATGRGEAPSPDCVVTLSEDAFLELLDALALHLGSLVKG
jgi:hypothetical protein